jgi:putative tricarboxylic transport membrane protein
MTSLWLAGVNGVFAFYPSAAIVVGVAVGIIFGSIPGLTATMAVALCLPMTFGVDPIIGMCLLCGLYVGGISGGLISAILINIPGTPSSVATCFDGYPMAAKGEAGKALGIGILYSFLGGLFSFIILFFLAPPLARFALRFGPFEYFSVAVFSLALVAGLAGRSLAKGVASALIGVSAAMVGMAPIDSYKRFTFGLAELDGGFDLLPVLIGLFAISEILREAETSLRPGKIEIKTFKMTGFMGMTWSEFTSQIWNFLRSSAIGTWIGILPGIGGGTSNLLAYMAAKNSSKYPEKFGTGIIDGVIASETANNASIGGAFVPLLTLGIPGDTVTAMLLGGFMIHGIVPGPMLFRTHGELVYTIFVALLVSNVVMLAMEYYALRMFVKLLRIPKHYLLPVILAMCVVGAFGLNNRVFDVWTILVFGVLGYVLEKFGYAFPPLILGFILGPMAETSLRRGLMSSQGSVLPFLGRPISGLLLAAAVIYAVTAVRKNMRVARLEREKKTNCPAM